MQETPRALRIGRVALWSVVLAGAIGLWWSGQRIPVRSAQRSAQATNLALQVVDGAALDLESLRGHVVLLNLWASWCAPCRTEMPRLERVFADLEGRGLVVLGLNREGLPPQELARLRREWDLSYPFVVSTTSLEGTTFEGRGVVPHNWLIDRQGRLRASRSGLASEGALRTAALRLLREPAASGAATETGGNAAAD